MSQYLIDANGLKFNSGTFSEVKDTLTLEASLAIQINKQAYTITMRTPGDDDYLVKGLMITEHIIDTITDITSVEVIALCAKGFPKTINVTIPKDKILKDISNNRSIMSGSSCGLCGKTDLKDIAMEGKALEHNAKLNPELIEQMFDTMNKHQPNFQSSGGAHAAAAFDIEGNLLSTKEDIGRHNAVDKVIGELSVKHNKQEVALCVSGRTSYEIVTKAYAGKISFLLSVSAPSSLAVEMAEKFGITIVGFCRGEKATFYSNTQHIKQAIHVG